jgi:hypothetical protein
MTAMSRLEQIACYRARAAEDEVTSYRDVHGADRADRRPGRAAASGR